MYPIQFCVTQLNGCMAPNACMHFQHCLGMLLKRWWRMSYSDFLTDLVQGTSELGTVCNAQGKVLITVMLLHHYSAYTFTAALDES